MKSVYAKVIIWCFAAILVSVVAFVFINTFVVFHTERGGMLGSVDAMILDQAVNAYKAGGPAKLSAYLDLTHRYLGDPRYLTDASGRDLVTGGDRSAMLKGAEGEWGRPHRAGASTISLQRTSDDRYRLIAVLNPPHVFWNLAPYYLMVLVAVGLLCWALASSIASPLRKLSRVVECFGHGELQTRAGFKRGDEIGELADAFDRMAERIGTLVAAERRLFQDFSHELRTPLARMSFAAELIRTAEDREAALARLKKEIRRLSTLIETLLQMTSAEGDPAESKHERVLLNNLLAEITQDCSMDADAFGCRLKFTANGDVANIGDRDLLRRAVENVVLNAIRYTTKGSSIEIGLGEKNSKALIWVRDYGPGVPDDSLAKIFQPFYRIDDSRNRFSGGVGLGLAIVRRAIALHHGRVWAENAHPGLIVFIETAAAPAITKRA